MKRRLIQAYRLLSVITLGVAIFPNTPSADGQLLVSVLNEDNYGVPSVVWLLISQGRTRLGQTDPEGEIAKKYKCDLGVTLEAAPLDRATYTNSRQEDCAQRVTLHVLHRQTPLGAATQVVTTPFTHSLAGKTSQYMVVDRGLVATALRNRAIGVFPSIECNETISPVIFRDLYKINPDGTWTNLQAGEKRSVGSASNTGWRPCNTVDSRRTQLIRKKAVILDSVIHNLPTKDDSVMRAIERYQSNTE